MNDFQEICRHLYDGQRKQGIGTLGEKTLHGALKAYYQPDCQYQEIRLGRYVADVVTDCGCIVEVQTRNFGAFKKKLEVFLKEYEVTVAYPVAKVKWICWVDPLTGEIGERRRSPRAGRPADLLKELYQIKNLLDCPNLHFRIPVLEVEEFRLRDGWGNQGKKRATKYERVPLRLYEELNLKNTQDFYQLLPQGLPEEFSSKDFKKASGLSMNGAQIALNVLFSIHIVQRIGKNGREYRYQVAK